MSLRLLPWSCAACGLPSGHGFCSERWKRPGFRYRHACFNRSSLGFRPPRHSAANAAIAYLLLQVGFDEEEAGLDAHHHGESAYAGEGRTADVAGRHPSVAQHVLLA